MAKTEVTKNDTALTDGGYTMKLQQRLSTISEQERAYITGTVELINDQWIFFDNESDEASLLDEIIDNTIEIFLVDKWMMGTFCPNGIIEFPTFHYQLRDGDELRTKKILSHVYKEWLEELSDAAFLQFTSMLNNYKLSLFDSIYCYNHLSFQTERPCSSGTNFIVFDNSEIVCNVLHHYVRGAKHQDRFEFTMCTGQRSLIANIS